MVNKKTAKRIVIAKKRLMKEEGKKSGIKTILNSADMKAIPLYERVGFHTSSTIMYIDL